MKITQPNQYHKCWWLGDHLRVVRIDLNHTEGRDWTQWTGIHRILGGGLRWIRKNGIMWEITT